MALIRHHFGTKQDLWCALVDGFVSKFEQRHGPLLAAVQDAGPVDVLRGLVTTFVRVAAELPGLSRIIINDGSQPGPHLDYVIERMMPIHRAIDPIFLAAQRQGLLRHHDPDTFFVFLMMAGSFPFALREFTNRFYQQDLGSSAGIERHCELVLKTLFAS